MLEKIKSTLIKYKFIFKDNINHRSYLYQKVFRSIYGYNQNVTKNNKKIYNYFRKGVISDIPYIKYGKNSIILPLNKEEKLIEYFKTGNNPTHNWKYKGDWKVEYNLSTININKEDIIKALESYLDKLYILKKDNILYKLKDELKTILFYNNNSKDNLNKIYIKNLLNKSESLIKNNWFTKVYNSSNLLNEFNNNYNKLKVKFNENNIL